MASKRIIKVQHGDEIRKTQVACFLNTISYNELLGVFKRKFSIKPDSITFVDEQGDCITVRDDEDVRFALELYPDREVKFCTAGDILCLQGTGNSVNLSDVTIIRNSVVMRSQ
jgi:hypothetical protein